MPSYDPLELPIPQRHQLLIGTVAPRPIAFASTLSEDGIPNLAPYSFFNVFSSNPPIAIFPATEGSATIPPRIPYTMWKLTEKSS